MNCDHIIGLSSPRRGEHKFIYASDRDKGWRGTVCWYCPNCGKRLWEWVEKEGNTTDWFGKTTFSKYKIKEYVGDKRV